MKMKTREEMRGKRFIDGYVSQCRELSHNSLYFYCSPISSPPPSSSSSYPFYPIRYETPQNGKMGEEKESRGVRERKNFGSEWKVWEKICFQSFARERVEKRRDDDEKWIGFEDEEEIEDTRRDEGRLELSIEEVWEGRGKGGGGGGGEGRNIHHLLTSAWIFYDRVRTERDRETFYRLSQPHKGNLEGWREEDSRMNEIQALIITMTFKVDNRKGRSHSF